MDSRRSFVRRLAAGAFAIGCVGSIAPRSASAQQRRSFDVPHSTKQLDYEADYEHDCEPGIITDPPWSLVAPVTRDGDLGHGWRLADLSGVQAGSFVVTLAHKDGRSQRVRICRNAGRPSGIVSTEECDLLIMNSGAGAQPTDEDLAQAVARLARAIAANEHAIESAPALVTMLTHEQCVTRFSTRGKELLQ